MIWVSVHPEQTAQDTFLVQGQESLCVTHWQQRTRLAVTTQGVSHSLSWSLQQLRTLHLLPSPGTGSVGAAQGCLCCPVLWNAADIIAMRGTLCLRVLAKLLVSLAPR